MGLNSRREDEGGVSVEVWEGGERRGNSFVFSPHTLAPPHPGLGVSCTLGIWVEFLYSKYSDHRL